MKTLLLADLHSNIYALKAIVAEEKDFDAVVCAGDVVDYGPFPCEVIDWLIDNDAMCVRGNHDESVARIWREMKGMGERVPVRDRRWSVHNGQALGEEHGEFLEKLPENVNFMMDGIEYLMVHQYGSDYQIIENLYDFERFFAEKTNLQTGSERRIIFGHTHRQGIHILSSDCLWINPGSISYRRPGDSGLQTEYATVTDGTISLKQVHYDRRPLIEAAESAGLTQSQLDWSYGAWLPEKITLK